ncbi:hypothetical protein FHQ25_12335, partial [Testudinibacter sp. TR-2022]|uniref:hypothetical protein n=1 Tax=Testudinibacter sp. TR-2022 TaxID=2585029 RepID=UPI00111B0431
MIFNKKIDYFLFISILLFSTIDLPSPIITYGSQLIGFLFLVVCVFFVYPRLSLKSVVLCFFVLSFLTIISLIQYSFLTYTSIFWYNFMRVSFWIMLLIILYNYIKHVSIFFINKSICILAVQLISVYAFDYIIDFSILIGGDEVRSFSSGFFPYRPTAVFSEPSI